MISSEGIWQELHASLRAFIARRVPAEDVDDILQDVFVRIHRGAATLAQQQRVEAWVYQITRNTISDYYRRSARPTAVTLEPALAETLADASNDGDDRPANVRAELAACLDPLLRRLPSTYREAVTIADFQGETQRGAAERLGLSVSGMKSRVQRGRAQLRNLLQACCELEVDHRGAVVDFEARPGGANCSVSEGSHNTCSDCGV
jgi:RNA polymerase sigma-70 factor (ECF subfamily)